MYSCCAILDRQVSVGKQTPAELVKYLRVWGVNGSNNPYIRVLNVDLLSSRPGARYARTVITVTLKSDEKEKKKHEKNEW